MGGNHSNIEPTLLLENLKKIKKTNLTESTFNNVVQWHFLYLINIFSLQKGKHKRAVSSLLLRVAITVIKVLIKRIF